MAILTQTILPHMEICKETIPISRSCNYYLVEEVKDLTLTEDDSIFISSD